eukprot:Opistho-1_new@72697
MSDDKPIILFKAAKELNIGIATAVEFLGKKGFAVENKPTTKLSKDMYDTLLREFQGDKIVKEEANQIVIGKIRRDEPEVAEKAPEVPRKKQDFENEGVLIKNLHSYTPPVEKPKEEKPVEAKQPEPVKEPVVTPTPAPAKEEESALPGVKIVGKIDLNNLNNKTRPDKKEEPAPVVEAKKETPAPVVEAPKAPEPVAATPAPVVTEKPVEKEAPKVEEQPKAQEAAPAPTPTPAPTPQVPAEDEVIKARSVKLSGPNIIGKIVLPTTPDRRNQPVASSGDSEAAKRKRKRKKTPGGPNTPQQGQGGQQQQGQQQARPAGTGAPVGNRPDFRNNTNNTAGGRPNFRNARPGAAPGGPKEEPTEKEIQDQIKATLARLSGAGKSGKFAQRAKLRRQKRDDVAL